MNTFFNNLKNINLLKILKIDRFERQLIFVVTIVLFVLVNIFLSVVSLRLDLSRGKAYTLAPSTKKLIQNLDKDVEIKLYVSSNLPTKLLPAKTEVVDLLREYDRQGKVKLSILDPKKDSKAAAEAKQYGIPETPYQQLEQNQFAVTNSVFGIAMIYNGNPETIPQITDLESLEYNVTSSIYKLTRNELPYVAIIGAEPTYDPSQDNLAIVKRILGQQFQVDPIDISSESSTIDGSKYKSMLVFSPPGKEYSQTELNAIKSYLDKKGNAIFFVDGVWVDPQNLQTIPQKNNILPFLKEYGINVQNNLVLSLTSEVVNFGNDLQSILASYPLWIKTNLFNPQVSYFSNIQQMTFPWVSSLEISPKSGYEVKDIIKSTAQSWEQKNTFSLNPQQIPEPQEKDIKQFIIGAESKNKDGGHIIVLGSSRFAQNEYLSKGTGNVEFILNILNELASGGALSGIRQRSVNIYPLPEIADGQKDFFTYANILVLPVMFALYGAVRLMRRSR